MGYYSDVALALTKNAHLKMTEQLSSKDENDKTRQEVERLLAYAGKALSDANTGAKCWLWREIKWYIDDPVYFPEVDFIEDLLAELDEEDFYFVRIGEESDDQEIRGIWWDNPFGMRLEREIVLEG